MKENHATTYVVLGCVRYYHLIRKIGKLHPFGVVWLAGDPSRDTIVLQWFSSKKRCS